jgi:hypothetical protein
MKFCWGSLLTNAWTLYALCFMLWTLRTVRGFILVALIVNLPCWIFHHFSQIEHVHSPKGVLLCHTQWSLFYFISWNIKLGGNFVILCDFVWILEWYSAMWRGWDLHAYQKNFMMVAQVLCSFANVLISFHSPTINQLLFNFFFLDKYVHIEHFV